MMKKIFMFAAVGMLVVSCKKDAQKASEMIQEAMPADTELMEPAVADYDDELISFEDTDESDNELIEEEPEETADDSANDNDASDSKKVKGLVPATTTISGPLGDYFTLVDGTYKCEWGKVKIKVRRNSKPFSFSTAHAGRFPGYEVDVPESVDTYIGFGVKLLDVTDSFTSGIDADTSSQFGKDNTKTIINAKTDEVVEIELFIGAINDHKDSRIEVTSAVQKK